MEVLPGIIATTIALAALGMVFALLAPSAILAMKPNWLRQRFNEPSEPSVADLWRRLEPTVQEVEKLGLRRLGVRTEWAGPLKSGKRESCELASSTLRVFATVGVLSRRKKTPFLYLLTPFKDGAIVFTATSTAHLATVAEDFAYGSIKGSAADLLQVHHARVQMLVQGGRVVASDFDSPGRLEACRTFYAHPRIRSRMKKTAWLIALQLAAVSACIFLVMFKLFGS
ncbi:MAG TPA: hypothetical protein VGK67_25315 [Myxococcales bacterium]|jgi:hypothetical protein